MTPHTESVLIVIDQHDRLARQIEQEPELTNTKVLWAPTVRAGVWLGRKFRDAVLLVGQTESGPDSADTLRNLLPHHTVCEYLGSPATNEAVFDISVGPADNMDTTAKLVSLLSVRITTRNLRRTMSTMFGVEDSSEMARPELPA
jgi:hypothetical protein